MAKIKLKNRQEIEIQEKYNQMQEAINETLNEFLVAYHLQKGTDLDDIELVVYTDKKRTLMYFRPKRKEIRIYGTSIIQDER